MQKMFLVLALLCISLSPDDIRTAKTATFFYTLGNRSIALKVVEYGRSKDIVMIRLHDDEAAAEEAARNMLERTGGILISIENNHQRYITFTRDGKTYRFDPNRIFTKNGVQATLQEQNKYSTKSAVNAIHGFAGFLLNKVPRHAFALIAVHNNDNGGLSVLTYMKGGDQERNATAVSRSDLHDPDNFFLTTDNVFFRRLRSAGYNVILQSNKAEDDGSLSVYYGRKHKRYINIEAETGNVKEQEKMIEAVVHLIRDEP